MRALACARECASVRKVLHSARVAAGMRLPGLLHRAFSELCLKNIGVLQGVSMPFLLQVDFEMDGPFGAAMEEAFAGLAHSINAEPGMIWKIWTEAAADRQAGGVYLFDTHENAEKYLHMHSARLLNAGIRNMRSRIFAVNEALSAINHGPVAKPSPRAL